ncbi:MAG: PAS domain-containing protein [Methylobacteriaceae bacterium]|nr:PAS domain-containing protein [Methylobacteriaceae bacterium]
MTSGKKGPAGRRAAPDRLEGRGEQSLDALCATAARLFAADAAALTLNQAGVSQVVASCGLAAPFRRYPWSFESANYGPDDLVLAPDASARADAQRSAHALGLMSCGLFVRAPVVVAADHSLALLILAKAPGAPFRTRQKRLLNEIIAVMREEFVAIAPMLLDPDNDVTVAVPLAEALARIGRAEFPECLLDAQMTIIAVNGAFAALSATPEARLTGQALASTNAPAADAIVPLARQALARRLSPPDIEIVREEGQRRRVFQLTVSPFSPKDTTDYFAHVRLREVTTLDALARRLAISVDRGAAAPAAPSEPTLAFLHETLVRKRSIRTRHELSYITLRAWRRPIREYQIKGLRALKADIPDEMPRLIAAELEEEARSLIGVAAFRAVVPVPCGHSAGPCLSVEIARALAAAIGAPVVQALIAPRRSGVSHPKDNARRPPLTLSRPVSEPLILVDDVATSGSHLEEAAQLLRPHCGALLAIAWIGGDSI